jgi:MraZ protein
MEAFRGNHTAKLEEGGRLKLPAPFKKILDDAHVTELYITSEDGLSAEVWPLSAWEKQEARYTAMCASDVAAEKFDEAEDYLELTSYYGVQVEMDKQGRVQLPQLLRGTAKLDGDVNIRGKLNHMVVQNSKILAELMATKSLTRENRRSLASVVSSRIDP